MTTSDQKITICCLAGDLGFGFPEASLERALALRPDAIALQGTSADPGPYYLGAGESFYPLGGVKRDLEILLPRAVEAGVPVIASAGGAGTRKSILPVVKIIKAIAKARKLNLRLAVIFADIRPEYLKQQIDQGVSIPRLGDWAGLSEKLMAQDIASSTHIVAQMGPEPIERALNAGADVILTGRTVDMSLFAAVPLMRGCAPGSAMHMAKILECGAMAAEPSTGADGLIATIEGDGFVVEPLSLERKCTIRSIAGHSFYEREDPFHDDLPGGHIDTSDARYEQLDPRRVRVSGARWSPSPYLVKIEGAGLVGYRTICIAGLRDPRMISQIESILGAVRTATSRRFQAQSSAFELIFRPYGKDAVLGPVEPIKSTTAHELGLVIDVVADTQEFADEVCGFVRSAINHDDYPGCRTSAGNVAFPFSPSDIRVGPVYRFTIWHLLPLEDPAEPFEVDFFTIANGRVVADGDVTR